jgi:hypothetical protein
VVEKLSEKEEKYLIVLEKTLKVSSPPFIIVSTVFPMVVMLELFLAAHYQQTNPVESKDRYWAAALLGTMYLNLLATFIGAKRLFKILQKIRK